MARYFNRSNGMLPVTLRDGKSVSIPGKSWVEFALEQEGSESLLRAVRRGYLYRWSDAEHDPKPAAPAKTEKSPVEVTPAAAPEVAPVEELNLSKRRKKSDFSSGA